MKKVFALAGVALMAATMFAQESGPKLTAYGMAQYRLRIQSFSKTPDNGDALGKMNYANQIGYFAGLKISVNDQVSMQFQAGNDWVSTEGVSWAANNWSAVGHAPSFIVRDTANKVATVAKNGLYPYFHLAYAKWDAKIVYVIAGIQPIASNGSLDLIERSMISNNYKDAALVTWIVGTNASVAGLKVGAPILKDNFKLGAELFTTVTAPRSQDYAVEPKSNPSAAMIILDLPMSVASLKVTPQVVAILNRNYNKATEKGDNEIGFGFAGSYKINDKLNATACFGMASVSTINSVDTSVASAYDNAGMVVGAGASYKVGPGAAIVDFKFSTDENKEVADSKSSYIYVDAKYGWDANKNFQIMPRIRVFMKQFEETNADKGITELRPEIIFTGKF